MNFNRIGGIGGMVPPTSNSNTTSANTTTTQSTTTTSTPTAGTGNTTTSSSGGTPAGGNPADMASMMSQMVCCSSQLVLCDKPIYCMFCNIFATSVERSTEMNVEVDYHNGQF